MRRVSAASSGEDFGDFKFSRRGSAYQNVASATTSPAKGRRQTIDLVHHDLTSRLDGPAGQVAGQLRDTQRLNPNDPDYSSEQHGGYIHHIAVKAPSNEASDGDATGGVARGSKEPTARVLKQRERREKHARKRREPVQRSRATVLPAKHTGGTSCVSVLLRPENPCTFREHARLDARCADTTLVGGNASAAEGTSDAAAMIRQSIASVYGQHPHHCRINVSSGNRPGAGVDASVKFVTDEDITKVRIDFTDLERHLELSLHLHVELSMRKRKEMEIAQRNMERAEREREATLERWRENEERRQAAEREHQKRRQEWGQEQAALREEIARMRERERMREFEMNHMRTAEAHREEERQREREAEGRADRRRKADEEAIRQREKEREEERRRAELREQEWRAQERAREAEMAVIEQERAQRDEERQKEKEAALQRKIERQQERERDSQWKHEVQQLLARQRVCKRCEERELEEEEKRCEIVRSAAREAESGRALREQTELMRLQQLRTDFIFNLQAIPPAVPLTFVSQGTSPLPVCAGWSVDFAGSCKRGFVHAEIVEGWCDGDKVSFLTRPPPPDPPADYLSAVSPAALIRQRPRDGGLLCTCAKPGSVELPVGFTVEGPPLERAARAVAHGALLEQTVDTFFTALLQSLCFTTTSGVPGRRELRITAAGTFDIDKGVEGMYVARKDQSVAVWAPMLAVGNVNVAAEAGTDMCLVPDVSITVPGEDVVTASRTGTHNHVRPSTVSRGSTASGVGPRALPPSGGRVGIGGGCIVVRARSGICSGDALGFLSESGEQDGEGQGKRHRAKQARVHSGVTAQGAVLLRGKKLAQVVAGQLGPHVATIDGDELSTRLRLDSVVDALDLCAVLSRITLRSSAADSGGCRVIDITVHGPGTAPGWSTTVTAFANVLPKDPSIEVLAQDQKWTYRLMPTCCRRFASQRRRSSTSSRGAGMLPPLSRPQWLRLLPTARVTRRTVDVGQGEPYARFRGGFIEALLLGGAKKGDELGLCIEEGSQLCRVGDSLRWGATEVAKEEAAGMLGSKHVRIDFAEDGTADAVSAEAILRAVSFRNVLCDDSGSPGVRSIGVYATIGNKKYELNIAVQVTMPPLNIPPLTISYNRNEWTTEGIPVPLGGPHAADALKLQTDQIAFASGAIRARIVQGRQVGDVLDLGRGANEFLLRHAVKVELEDMEEFVLDDWTDGTWTEVRTVVHVGRDEMIALLYTKPGELLLRFRSIRDQESSMGDLRGPTSAISTESASQLGQLLSRPSNVPRPSVDAEGQAKLGVEGDHSMSRIRKRGSGMAWRKVSRSVSSVSAAVPGVKEPPKEPPAMPASTSSLVAEAQSCIRHLVFSTSAPPGVGGTRVISLSLEDATGGVCEVFVEVENSTLSKYELIRGCVPQRHRQHCTPRRRPDDDTASVGRGKTLVCPTGDIGVAGDSLSGYVLTAEIVGGGDQYDRLGIADIGLDDNAVYWCRSSRSVRVGGKPVAHVGEVTPASLRVSFSSSTRAQQACCVLRALCFWNTSPAIREGPRNVRLALVPPTGIAEGCCSVSMSVRMSLLSGVSPAGFVYVERSGRRRLISRRMMLGISDGDEVSGAFVRMCFVEGAGDADEIGLCVEDAEWCLDDDGVLHHQAKPVCRVKTLVGPHKGVEADFDVPRPAGTPPPTGAELKMVLGSVFYASYSCDPDGCLRVVSCSVSDGHFTQEVEVHVSMQSVDDKTVVVLKRPSVKYVVRGAPIFFAADARVLDADTEVCGGSGAALSATLGPSATTHDQLDVAVPRSDEPVHGEPCRIDDRGYVWWRDPGQAGISERRVATVERRVDGLALKSRSWRVPLSDCPLAAVEHLVRRMTYVSTRPNQKDRNQSRQLEFTIRATAEAEPTVTRVSVELVGPYIDAATCNPRRFVIGGGSPLTLLPDFRVVRDSFNGGSLVVDFDVAAAGVAEPPEEEELLICLPPDAPMSLDTVDGCTVLAAPVAGASTCHTPKQGQPADAPSAAEESSCREATNESPRPVSPEGCEGAAGTEGSSTGQALVPVADVTLTRHLIRVVFRETPPGEPHTTAEMVTALVQALQFDNHNQDAVYVSAAARISLVDEFGNMCSGTVKIDS
eukprot:TRINITY_DN10533_c0_g1_i1.p1 TRINITY_DN10533_c0_g1~~TRINITY_DN10533_c0_g1_i1.p1  ORF type:complete len:2221 (+),score=582.20 TRINITY_DN10533_c0_g1_i1:360-6665(+)